MDEKQKSKEVRIKILFFTGLVIAILIILPVIICIYLQLFFPSFCKEQGIEISNVINPLSYVLTVVSLGLGFWSVAQAARSNKEARKLMDSVREIEISQSVIARYVIQQFHEGKASNGSWNKPDDIDD